MSLNPFFATGERCMAEVILAIRVKGHHHPAPPEERGRLSNLN
jgi:hypothetical protein